MNIELFVSKDGRAVFACDGKFDRRIHEILIDTQTGLASFVFAPGFETEEMNCAVDMETCEKIKNRLFCAVGYFKNGKLTASEYVRLRCL